MSECERIHPALDEFLFNKVFFGVVFFLVVLGVVVLVFVFLFLCSCVGVFFFCGFFFGGFFFLFFFVFFFFFFFFFAPPPVRLLWASPVAGMRAFPARMAIHALRRHTAQCRIFSGSILKCLLFLVLFLGLPEDVFCESERPPLSLS